MQTYRGISCRAIHIGVKVQIDQVQLNACDSTMRAGRQYGQYSERYGSIAASVHISCLLLD